jgi:hypothetical protein
MKTKNMINSVFWVLMISSCSTISYTPRVSLDISPKTIHKSVTVEKFVDNTPAEEKKNPFAGFSVTNEEALANDLSTEVTNAIISDFHTNAVFEDISRRADHPDFIMKGEINKFKGTTRLTNYGIISMCTIVGIYTWWFGMPIRKNETDVELVISLYNSNNELIGKYSGTYQEKVRASIYKNKSLGVLTQTNKSFSQVVSDIRQQILKDINKYEH